MCVNCMFFNTVRTRNTRRVLDKFARLFRPLERKRNCHSFLVFFFFCAIRHTDNDVCLPYPVLRFNEILVTRAWIKRAFRNDRVSTIFTLPGPRNFYRSFVKNVEQYRSSTNIRGARTQSACGGTGIVLKICCEFV